MAWVLFVVMVCGFVLLIGGAITGTPAVMIFGILFFFGADTMCAVSSAGYMSKPNNGEITSRIPHYWCGSPEDSRCGDGNVYGSGGVWYSDGCNQYNSSSQLYEVVECIAPTQADNPYEQQPLHPLGWIGNGILGTLNFLRDHQPIKMVA